MYTICRGLLLYKRKEMSQLMKTVQPAFNILEIIKDDLNWSRFRWNSPKAEQWIHTLRLGGYIIRDEEAFFLEVKRSLDEYNDSLLEIEMSPENTTADSRECTNKYHEHVELLPTFVRRIQTNELQAVIRDEYCPTCNCVWTRK